MPFAYLASGMEVRDVRHIPLEASSSPTCHRLEVGLYHADGSRLTAYAQDGQAILDSSIPVAGQGH
jgi:hypothetical protein